MDKQEIIQKTVEMIKEKFLNEGSGHDWWHIYRVWQLARSIVEKESADSFCS